jgi:hypothetical protein
MQLSKLSGLERQKIEDELTEKLAAIRANFSVNSSSIFCLSSPDNLDNCISKIALACISVNSKVSIKEVLASSLFLDALITLIISSI